MTFEESIRNFKTRLVVRGYPKGLIEKTLSEVNFKGRKATLTQKQKARKKILPFVTQYRPSVPCLKEILMSKWHLIENQTLLREIFKEGSLVPYKKRRSLKDMLVRAKL